MEYTYNNSKLISSQQEDTISNLRQEIISLNTSIKSLTSHEEKVISNLKLKMQETQLQHEESLKNLKLSKENIETQFDVEISTLKENYRRLLIEKEQEKNSIAMREIQV